MLHFRVYHQGKQGGISRQEVETRGTLPFDLLNGSYLSYTEDGTTHGGLWAIPHQLAIKQMTHGPAYQPT